MLVEYEKQVIIDDSELVVDQCNKNKGHVSKA